MESARGALHGPGVRNNLTGVPGGLVCAGVGGVGLGMPTREKALVGFSFCSLDVFNKSSF